MENNTPIDIVYLWVNGEDPTWRTKRQRAMAQLGHHHELALYGNVEGRFRDNDELRYSLRALEKFFPAHGHIYIVTDGQTPPWLRTSDRLTIIDHTDLIPAASLPTFDSGNIESYIHRIPKLSERFFYLNDDVFFGAPVNVNDWFWKDGIYVTYSDEPMVSDEPLRSDATSLENACRQSSRWFKTTWANNYVHTFRTFAHSPRPMRKSDLFALEKIAPEMFERVRSTVFRVWNKPTIISDFVIRWALAQNIAKTKDYAFVYLSTGDLTKADQLEQLVSLIGKVDFFCLNDTTDDAPVLDPRLTSVREALQRMFASASSFEIAPLLKSPPRRTCFAQLKPQESFAGDDV
jgi:Stealth protein CR2, conserved region 2/Stealth protein CR1, conserved region 1